MRHSKSDWENTNLEDVERPLSKRGKKNARKLGKYIRDSEIVADTALVSPSIRTKETLEIIRKYSSISKNILFIDEIYGADDSELLKLIRELSAGIQIALLIGHNPGLEILGDYLLFGDKENPSFGDKENPSFAKFPTSAFLSLAIESEDWKDWGRSPARLIRFWIP